MQHHREWFIVVLFPHIRLPLMQEKVASQAEALEIAMKLEASPIAETSVGMVVDVGKNPSQQRGSLPVPQVPIRLTNVCYGKPDEIMDPLPSRG